MEVDISNAVKFFFRNASFELVFFEAIANAIDACASEITVTNRLQSLKESTSIEVEITDNGVGFIDENFSKFSSLLKAETPDHKGLGRLVFLNYFTTVDITSWYGKEKREFTFNDKFTGDSKISFHNDEIQETRLVFSGYKKDRLKSYDLIDPSSLKESITRHFFPILYEKKIKNQNFRITICRHIENPEHDSQTDSEVINVISFDDLKAVEIPALELDLLSNLKILYSVNKVTGPSSVITAVCSDGRSIPLALIEKSQLPEGYELIFVVYSDYFTGKSDSTRQKLMIQDGEMKTLNSTLLARLSDILKNEIPEIRERNQAAVSIFTERYPHLSGYFDQDSIGLIARNTVLENAQKEFFSAQREILDAVELDDERYAKSIEISSRVLMEYILYRTLIIKKLKKMDNSNSEADIHNTIVPMRRVLKHNKLDEQIFFNNAWLLDDKFMNFNSILSDVEMSKLAEELKITDNDMMNDKRPDLTIVFSSDIEMNEKVDVIVIEFKKKGLPLARREDVVSQLKQRARKLLKYYPGKIQRIWFYGIADFSKEFIASLVADDFIELYSKGNLYYREIRIPINDDDLSNRVPAGFFVLDYDAFINDAEARNSTFLSVLKSGFNK